MVSLRKNDDILKLSLIKIVLLWDGLDGKVLAHTNSAMKGFLMTMVAWWKVSLIMRIIIGKGLVDTGDHDNNKYGRIMNDFTHENGMRDSDINASMKSFVFEVS